MHRIKFNGQTASMIRSFSLEIARAVLRCDLAVTFDKLRHDRH
jgi:hypothetical protein